MSAAARWKCAADLLSGRAGAPGCDFGTLVPTPPRGVSSHMSGRAEAPGFDFGTLVPTPAHRVSSIMSGRAEAPGCVSAPWCPPLPAASASRYRTLYPQAAARRLIAVSLLTSLSSPLSTLYPLPSTLSRSVAEAPGCD
ncbi:MAG: hypothetical protein RLZZ436_1822, partial [Planctomycetota bacterium]